MSDKVNMSLDDIISSSRGRRGGGGRGGFGRGGTRGGGWRGRGRPRNSDPIDRYTRPGRIPDGNWSHDRYSGNGEFGRGRRESAMNATARLMISNLDFGVSDSDIKELFGEFGPIRRCNVHYDKSGRSQGTAEVIYERRADASRAMRQYNDVSLDGRAMKISLVGAPQTETRLGPIRRSGGGSPRGGGRSYGGEFRGGGGGFRGGRGRGRRDTGPQKTAEELDAELDAYVKRSE